MVEDVDRYGNVRLYVRKSGQPKIRLHESPGSAAFLEEYRRALAGKPVSESQHPGRKPASRGSLRWLIEQYFGSAEFRRLDSRTQYVRRRLLDAFCEAGTEKGDIKHGDKPFARMEARHVRRIRDEKADRPEAANAILKALRQIFAYGIAAEIAHRNPAKDVPYITTGSTGFHTWTLEEVHQYEDRHAIGTKARLALALLMFLGGRRADVVAFGKQHIRDPENMAQQFRELHPGKWLRYTQHKNRNRKPVTLEIPLLPELAKIIAASPCGELTFLITEFGKPYTPNGFGGWFRRRCDEAGLKNCSAHGVRKAGATIAAENGATPHQLMAIFGWTTLKQAEVYTRAASQKRLAGGAMALLSRGQSENESVPLSGVVEAGGTKHAPKLLK